MTMQAHLRLSELHRTPGAIKQFHIDTEMGDAIEVGLTVVPRDRLVAIEGTAESVGDGVLVSATVDAVADGQCARCLTALSLPQSVEFQELYVYPDFASEYEEVDVTLIKGDSIDLGSAIRDAIIVNQPTQTLCRPDCLGLCPTCGVNLNDDPEHHHDEPIDSRWSALAQWGSMS